MKYRVMFETYNDAWVLKEFDNLKEAQAFARKEYDESVWDEEEEGVEIYDENNDNYFYP